MRFLSFFFLFFSSFFFPVKSARTSSVRAHCTRYGELYKKMKTVYFCIILLARGRQAGRQADRQHPSNALSCPVLYALAFLFSLSSSLLCCVVCTHSKVWNLRNSNRNGRTAVSQVPPPPPLPPLFWVTKRCKWCNDWASLSLSQLNDGGNSNDDDDEQTSSSASYYTPGRSVGRQVGWRNSNAYVRLYQSTCMHCVQAV